LTFYKTKTKSNTSEDKQNNEQEGWCLEEIQRGRVTSRGGIVFVQREQQRQLGVCGSDLFHFVFVGGRQWILEQERRSQRFGRARSRHIVTRQAEGSFQSSELRSLLVNDMHAMPTKKQNKQENLELLSEKRYTTREGAIAELNNLLASKYCLEFVENK